MAWIKYTDENGVRVENDEDGSTLFHAPSDRLGAMAEASVTNALRALLYSGELAGDTFIDDDNGIVATGTTDFESQSSDPAAPPSRHAGLFPHVGVP